MATSTSAQDKPPAAPKAPPAPRKQAAPPGNKRRLQVRHYAVLKPHRVYALVVEVPRQRKEAEGEGAGGGVVVVRPVVAGAQVVPAEQRLDVSAPGNQVTFHVTPLARGRLPHARVEVFAPGQAPQEVPAPTRATTQRLTWVLLALGLLVPWYFWTVTRDDVNTFLAKHSEDPQEVRKQFFDAKGREFAGRMTQSLERDWIKVPFFNTAYDPASDGGWAKYKLTENIDGCLEVGYADLLKGVAQYRLLLAVAVVLLGLALVSWMLHRPRRVVTRKLIAVGTPGAEAGEPVTLEPIP